MKKYFYLLTAALLISLFTAPVAKASHVAGGEITYAYMSPNSYLVTLKVYRDCIGVQLGTSKSICYSSATSGQTGNFTVTLLPGSGLQLPPTPCISIAYCYEEYVFQGTVTLPSAQPDWRFSWDECCRNNAITTLTPPGGQSMVVYTTLDNVAAPTNSSPVFTYIPNIRFCINNQFYYSNGAIDPDGDLLTYALDVAEQGPGCPANITPCVYVAPWSATNPITTLNGTTIDSLTGTVAFYPTTVMKGVICIKVYEWRVIAGVTTLIGTIKRDIQISLEASGCNIVTPNFTGNIIQNGIPKACGDYTFILSFDNPIQCGSVTATDVRVTDPNGYPNPVISAVPINCLNNLTDSILVTLFNPLIGTNGDTSYAFTKVGNDGNTFLGECGTAMPEFDSIRIYVTDPNLFAPLQANVGCYFADFTLNFNVNMWCQTIAGDLSDFTLTDGAGTNIPISSITGNCNPFNPFSYESQFTFNFTGGATGVSPLYLTVNTGTDANTIANWCGTFFAPGDTLAILTIQNNIIVNLGPDITICDAQTTPLLDCGIPGAGVTYQWYNGGVAIGGAASQTYQPTATGSYSVNVSYGATCNGGDTVNVNIIPTPQPTLGTDITLCIGDPIPTLDCQVPGPGVTYQWYNGGVAIPGETNQTYTPTAAGTYSVLVSAGTCSGGDTISITINSALPVNLGPDQTVCENQTLPLLDAGVTATSYQWYNTSGTISGATNQTYQVPNVVGTTQYWVVATSSCTGSDTIDVTINAAPSVSLGPDMTVCITDGFTLNAGNAGSTYQWYENGVLQTATGQIYTPTTNGLINYSVTVTNADNCTGTASVNITVFPSAPTPVVNSASYCSGNIIPLLDAGVTGVSYQWYDPQNVIITGATNQTYQPTGPGTYTVVVNIGTCTASGQGTITEVQNPTVANLGNPALCQGQAFPTLDAGFNSGYTYLWSTNETTNSIVPTAAGTYTVTVTNSGCTATAQSTVTVNANPAPTVGDQTICESDNPVTFTATGTFNNPTYLWSTGSTDQSIQTNNQGTYTVTVTDVTGCSGTVNALLTVNANPDLSVTSASEIHEGHIHVCKLDSFPVLNASSTVSGVYIIWTFPDLTTSYKLQ